MVFSGRQGARTYVECHDGQPSAAGLHPSPIVISPLWQTDGKTIRKNGSAEKWRKCGIVGNCLRWLRSWGLGKSVAERRAADKNGSALQCTIWDRESFRNDEDKIQRHARTKTKTNTKTKRRAADKKQSTAMHYMGSHIATAMHYMGPRILWKWWWSKSSNNFEMQCGLQKVTNWS